MPLPNYVTTKKHISSYFPETDNFANEVGPKTHIFNTQGIKVQCKEVKNTTSLYL